MLIDAIRRSDVARVRELVRMNGRGVDLGLTLPNGDTLLHLAVRSSADKDIFKALVEDGKVDIARENKGASAYELAQENQSLHPNTGTAATYLKSRLDTELKETKPRADVRRAVNLVAAGAEVSLADLKMKDAAERTSCTTRCSR